MQSLFANPQAMAAYQLAQGGALPQTSAQAGFAPRQAPAQGFLGGGLLQGEGLFPGGAPTMGTLRGLTEAQRQGLYGGLGMFGIEPGLLGSRAQQVTPAQAGGLFGGLGAGPQRTTRR